MSMPAMEPNGWLGLSSMLDPNPIDPGCSVARPPGCGHPPHRPTRSLFALRPLEMSATLVRPTAGAPSSTRGVVQRLVDLPALSLSIIVIVGVALRVFHLTYLSLWNDELFSRFYYQTGLAYMWTEGLRSESSPPLYYMALGAWIQVFGSGEAALRALSVAASSVAILLVYMLGKEILTRPQALLAAGLFALSATQIYFAQEARPYALLLMPVAGTLLACARYLRGSAGAWNLACYGTCSVLCIYTHA